MNEQTSYFFEQVAAMLGGDKDDPIAIALTQLMNRYREADAAERATILTELRALVKEATD